MKNFKMYMLNNNNDSTDAYSCDEHLRTTGNNTIIYQFEKSATKRPSATKLSHKMQKKKYMQVISILNQHNQHLEEELVKEKRRRTEELSKIIKSLLCFEAKLKHDKKVINQKMYEKDTDISRLITFNRMLRQKFNNLNEEDLVISDNPDERMSQICPNCRKHYYEINGKDVWTQTISDGRINGDDQTEHGSSSDETLSSSFCGARRSIRYTSKRTFGTFQDYMRSRSMSIDDLPLDNSEENNSTLSREDSSSIYEKTNIYSRKIERLHGVRQFSSLTDGEIDEESERVKSNNCDNESDEVFLPIKSSNYRNLEFAEMPSKHEFEASTDDWYASASDIDDSENIRAKPYGYNAVNPVLECVNQILLQQSMEESIIDEPTSLDGSENNSGSSGSNKSGTYRKRVHFSTKNSMVHVPRENNSSSKSFLDHSDSKDCNLNYESIYSNEYERIDSERNSSNHYVDMDSKLGQEDCIIFQEKPKKPPALPPKPANLMKFKRVLRVVSNQPKEDEVKINDTCESEPDYCSISEVSQVVTSVQIVADVHKSADADNSSVSSETNTPKISDDVEEIFADIPKLPNVAAIIAPKAINKFINPENYITKENDQQKPTQIPNILAEITKKLTPTSTPVKLSPINGLTSPSKCTPKSTNTANSANAPPTEDKLPLQAEFDWYNLDAEYGKSNQPDVIKETDATKVEYELVSTKDMNKINHGVEYNLDEEFCLGNQPDIIKENGNELKSTTTVTTMPTITVCEVFPTIVDCENPCTQQVVPKPNFSAFIDNSGLSTKPLPRQRKIYFSGPFV